MTTFIIIQTQIIDPPQSPTQCRMLNVELALVQTQLQGLEPDDGHPERWCRQTVRVGRITWWIKLLAVCVVLNPSSTMFTRVFGLTTTVPRCDNPLLLPAFRMKRHLHHLCGITVIDPGISYGCRDHSWGHCFTYCAQEPVAARYDWDFMISSKFQAKGVGRKRLGETVVDSGRIC